MALTEFFCHLSKCATFFMFAAIHRNSPRPVKVPRCHSDPPNPHLIIPTPEGFRYLASVQSSKLVYPLLTMQSVSGTTFLSC